MILPITSWPASTDRVPKTRRRYGPPHRKARQTSALGAPCASRQGPSPLPQHNSGIRTGRGPKPPASARPATGGRFSPTGSGAGLCFSRTSRSTGQRPARAGKRNAFPVPARTGESTITASMAGAIAPATSQRRDQDRPGAQSPRPAPAPPPAGASRPPGRALASVSPTQCCAGIRTGRGPKPPASPRPAPTASARPPAGASRPPGRALASVPPGPAGLQGTVPRGRGKRGSRFPVPPERDNPFPRIRRVPTGRRPDYNFGTLLSPQGCCGNPPVRMCRRQGAGRGGGGQRIGKKPETGRTGA